MMCFGDIYFPFYVCRSAVEEYRNLSIDISLLVVNAPIKNIKLSSSFYTTNPSASTSAVVHIKSITFVNIYFKDRNDIFEIKANLDTIYRVEGKVNFFEIPSKTIEKIVFEMRSLSEFCQKPSNSTLERFLTEYANKIKQIFESSNWNANSVKLEDVEISVNTIEYINARYVVI